MNEYLNMDFKKELEASKKENEKMLADYKKEIGFVGEVEDVKYTDDELDNLINNLLCGNI